ncbi:MAG TPA: acyl-CoA dehydratase activase [Phycisphaerae bacterium]|nr:acyl-CoA dehydratase activase [Phycisphaerae bacterium]
MYLGIDIGSVSLNLVLLDDQMRVVKERYVRTRGKPLETALAALEELFAEVAPAEIDGVAFTGAGTAVLGELYGIKPVNEVVAQAKATAALHPDVRTIIEIGGEDSKLILLEEDPRAGCIRIRDFAMNMLCAAGTGSFLDQQASRLGVSIEDEWGEMAMKSVHVPRIAGRCSVFAKSDMIHLQQEGTPDYDIVAGLCFAMARNFKAVIGKGKEFASRIAFQGGVAANAGMVRAFRETLDLEDGELLIPEHFASMGAIGAVLVSKERGELGRIASLEPLRKYLASRRWGGGELHPALEDDGYPLTIEPDAFPPGDEPVDIFVGVDVGSISTNVVATDSDGRVLAREYLMTAGRPLAAVTDGLYKVGAALAERGGKHRLRVRGCATTGSGRYLTGDFIGADVVKNEITAHATGAIFIRPDVDTIFEIGGQDSKYISIDNGAVVDFAMNKVCAAGTGSFIEEQSERLAVELKSGEYNRLALSADEPPAMGERCTVFIETDINRNQQRGVEVDDLCAGLCYSIVQNYLNRVVEDRRVADVIFFQGGTAYNRGVKAAFEKVTGKPIIVPPHHDVVGAIGMALIARDWYTETGKETTFRGFDLTGVEYSFDTFECEDCANRCEIHVVEIKGEPGPEGAAADRTLHYGSRCGKYDESQRDSLGKHLPRLFVERQRMMEAAYARKKPDAPNGKTVGLPQMTHFWETMPIWRALFTEMGFEVVLSSRTVRGIVNRGVEEVAAETCFPIKVAHGHVRDLVEKRADYIFLPTIVDMPKATDDIVNSYVCPYVQSVPFMVRAAMPDVDWEAKMLSPTIHFSRGEKAVRKELEAMAARLGVARSRARRATDAAFAAQKRFEAALQARGREVLESLDPQDLALVIVSRPYNGCDPGLNLNIPEKLRDLGRLAIPLDMLPLDGEDISAEHPHMYWGYGRKILAGVRIIARDRRLYPVYITNFGCGPDSFIMKYIASELEGKPCLILEVDEHSADVGAITRCEAFLDSLKGVREREARQGRKARLAKLDYSRKAYGKRTVYIPYMDDHGFAMAAAMRAGGVEARQMPMSDEDTIMWGRKYTSGKECYPCIITTGDFLRQIHSPGFDPDRSAFFMPTAFGPCRFGQYNKFQRMVLDELGLEDVPLVLLDQDKDFQGDVKNLGTDFRKLAWIGIVFVDTLQKMLRETRPYEVHKGECDQLYEKYLRKCEQVIEGRGDLVALALEARSTFEDIATDRSRPRPRIGIVGEVFVRSNQFTNNFMVRKIETLGGEAVMPPFEEWVNYIGWSRKEDAKIERNWKRLLVEKVTDLIQGREKRKVLRQFEGAVRHFFNEPPSDDVIALGKTYLDPAVRGEPILSMGRCVEYVHDGCDGVVNLHPFNCMPGTIVNALLTKFQKDHDMPVLKVAYDGLEQATEMVRIEAFMHQCRERFETRLRDAGNGAGVGPGGAIAAARSGR